MEIPEWRSETKWCVYKHTAPSGKVYIGMTHDTNHRWRKNGFGYKSQTRFWGAIQKYGWENIRHEIVATELTKEEAEQIEIALIEQYHAMDFDYGYNCTKGGHYFPVERAHCPEAIEKSRQTRKKNRAMGKRNKSLGMKYPPEICEKFSKAHKGLLAGDKHPLWGKHLKEETKRKIGDAHRGIPLSEEHKRKVSESLKGLFAGEKHPLYGTHLSEETKEKISLANTGHYHSDETKQKIRESHKKRWENTPHPLLGTHQSPEHIQKRMDAIKACGYVTPKGKDSPLYGREVSKETRKKQSLAKSKPIIQYDINGNFLRRWDNSVSIGKELPGYNRVKISECCRGLRDSYQDCFWKFEKDVLSTHNPPACNTPPSLSNK